jgi:L-ascorbate metabolism protein UlaG (beta-lactamase superfamily)
VVALAVGGCAIAPQPKTGPYHSSDAPLSVTRIVHGSYLLDFAGVRILVDPWYYPRWLVNQREPLGLTFRSLPTLHAILITHGHGDHLDPKALAALPDHQLPVIARRGLRKAIVRAGYANVTDLDWWETAQVDDVVIHAVPADHTTEENGYILQHPGVTVYAAGDTRFFAGLHDIARRFPSVDVALLPIGGLRLFGFLTEMRPKDAARAVQVLQPHRVIPTHYGLTAPLPVYWTARHPLEALRQALDVRGIEDGRLVVIATGESWHYYAE